MSDLTLRVTNEQAREMPMVDLAFEILKSANTPYYYRDLMQKIAQYKQLSEEDVLQVIAQVYTEINIDGRFACVGTNLWGLKRWYPVEKTDDSIGNNTKRPRIINDDDDLDDEDLFVEEEEEFEVVADELENYDVIEAEGEDFFDVSDEIEEAVPFERTVEDEDDEDEEPLEDEEAFVEETEVDPLADVGMDIDDIEIDDDEEDEENEEDEEEQR
jgi:DNA-directed RNA polymerase subunit delta